MTNRIAVVGLGLIGGSIAAALRRQGDAVCGYDRSPAATEIALRLGLVDAVAPDLATACAGADAVVVAAPVLAIVDLLPAIDTVAPKDTLILDTGSVKSPIVATMERLPGAERAVGGHPIAGNERSGPEAADSGLLRGQLFVLCSSEQTGATTLRRARDLVSRLDMRLLELSAADHDRVLARTSHLPQFLSTVLALSLEPGDIALSGPALRDMTRLAASDPLIWRDIAGANRENILSAIRRFRDQLDDMESRLETGDLDGVERRMGEARDVTRSPRPPVAGVGGVPGGKAVEEMV